MIESRKEDHMDICLEENVELDKDYWNMLKFYHNSAPEIDFQEIDTTVEFLGTRLSAPIMVSAITGGYSGAEKINARLAGAAEELGIPFGVGSQRAALDNMSLRDSYDVIKDYDPPLVFGNLGAPQLVDQDDKRPYGVEEALEALKMIDGDYLAVHFNYLQEVVQPEGDTNAKGLLDALTEISDKVPTIAKETGAGMSIEVAERLQDSGVKALDVGGMGGTSFSAVEYFRIEDQYKKSLAEEFWDWGIPTPVSTLECSKNVDVPIISTGGIRNGIEASKAIALGAEVAGIAGGVLPHVKEGKDQVVKYLQHVIHGLKVSMFLQGCSKIEDLKNTKMIVTGELRDWISSL
ncbi:MAG: type 2 isopentenyl-diphosphate Delta-isomerase [Candidatus Saliniplasma sp.]